MNEDDLFALLESQTTAGQVRRVQAAAWAAAWAVMTTITAPLLRVGQVRRAALVLGDAIAWLGRRTRARRRS